VEERYSMRRSAELFASVVRETVGTKDLGKEVKEWQPNRSRSSGR
jgi:hypothetical protein